ncbi:MAG: DUF488 domain-containing protein [Bacillota bacterium]|nr:DUF488 domain-containing protein [Bacillota bacterium]
MPTIFLKRVYEPFDETDGVRVLIDRLWPRGISKEEAHLSYWLKDVAPSSELRKWFCHKPELFEEFRLKYLEELKGEKIEALLKIAREDNVTLLYGAKDQVYNHAVVLLEELNRRLESAE